MKNQIISILLAGSCVVCFNNCSKSRNTTQQTSGNNEQNEAPIIRPIDLKIWEKQSESSFSGTVIASDPSVIKANDTYYMYYTDLDLTTDRTYIALATSSDGKNCTKITSTLGLPGAVLVGSTGTWSENMEAAEAVLYEDKVYLYFSGYLDIGGPELNEKGFPASVGLAISDNFKDFTRTHFEPIIEPSTGWYDHHAVTSPTVIYDNGFKMMYAGHCYGSQFCTNVEKPMSNFVIGATSIDGINWTKLPEPLLFANPTISWMDWGAAEPTLVKLDNHYQVIFTGLHDEERVLGFAETTSFAEPWEIHKTPVLEPSPNSPIDSIGVLAPTVLIEGDQAHMWYLGNNPNPGFTIGYCVTK